MPVPSTLAGPRALAAVRREHDRAGPQPALDPGAYARGHAAFEARSDQRRLVGEYLAGRLAARRGDRVAVLSVGCGDGTLDAGLAAGLADAVPGRAVRWVGVEPYAASAARFDAALRGLGRPSLSVRTVAAAFDEAPLAETFDVVWFVHSMYYVPEVAPTLKAAHALLRPGGELLVLTAPRAELNQLAGLLAPAIAGHRQWFSDDVTLALAEAGLTAERLTLEARADLSDADDDVLDFTVQARLDPSLRAPVRAYLAAITGAEPDRAVGVPHPVDVHRIVATG